MTPTKEQMEQIDENIRKGMDATWVEDDVNELMNKIGKSITDHYKKIPNTSEINIILNYDEHSTFTIVQKQMIQAINAAVNHYPFTNRDTLKCKVVFNGLGNPECIDNIHAPEFVTIHVPLG